METFEEVDELITQLETNQIVSRDEAIRRIEEARVFIGTVHNRLGRLKKSLESDPLSLWRIRQNILAENFFRKVIDE